MSERFTGYPIELERREELRSGAIAFRGALGAFTAPDEIDPRSWYRIEDQGQVGSCQGQTLAAIAEFCFRVAMGGDISHFSAMWCYLRSQHYDGLLGRDAGSTLDAGRRVATQEGFAPEEVFPYPGRYVTRIPEGAAEAAAQFKIKYHADCQSYQDVFDFLASGQGAVATGTAWGWEPNNAGLIESFRPSGGGHAVPFLGYSKRTDSKGRKYLWLPNSWGKSWGKDGWAEVAPKAVDDAFRHSHTVMIGYSDLTVPTPRKVDFSKMRPLG